MFLTPSKMSLRRWLLVLCVDVHLCADVQQNSSCRPWQRRQAERMRAALLPAVTAALAASTAHGAGERAAQSALMR